MRKVATSLGFAGRLRQRSATSTALWLIIGLTVSSCSDDGAGSRGFDPSPQPFPSATGPSPAATQPLAPAPNNMPSGQTQPGSGAGGSMPGRAGGAPNTALQAALENRQIRWQDPGPAVRINRRLTLCSNGVAVLGEGRTANFMDLGTFATNSSGFWSAPGSTASSVVGQFLGTDDPEQAVPFSREFALGFAGAEVVSVDGFSVNTFVDATNLCSETLADFSNICAQQPMVPFCQELARRGGVQAGGPGTATSGNGPCPGIASPQGECQTCLLTSCCAQASTCLAGSPCGNALACLTPCPGLDAACVQAFCAPDVAQGLTALANYSSCSSTFCANSCF
jgi:hypothetical protein